MTWTAERTTINQVVNIGAEATTALGTSVSAGKRLECFDWTFGINPDVKEYTPTGHKYVTVTEENLEATDFTLGGTMDYNGVLYPLASIMGSVAVATHGSSGTAKDWIYTPPIVQPSVVPQTYTIEQGDSVRAQKLTYGLFTDWGYKMTRKDTSINGKGIGLAIVDAITLTNSPSTVALSPIVGKHVNVYLDNASGSLGNTQLTRVLSLDYLFSNVYGPFYPLNRTNVSWTAHVDLKPKCTVKLLVEADANGMALLTYMQNGTTYWLRVNATGPQIASDGPGVVNATFQHDMAIRVVKTTPWKDDQGIYAIEWELTVIEDATWGKAQTLTVTNLITAL